PEATRAFDPRSDVRAAAADALARDHSEAALLALLRATADEPLVAGAAIRALDQHRSAEATVRIREHLCSLVGDLGQGESTDAKRRKRSLQAVLGLGSMGLLSLLARRSYAQLEADLVAWWRTHPVDVVKAAAAAELVGHSVDHACSILREGLPG